MKKLCVTLMALVAVFLVSCSTETDIIEENDGGKDVTLTISTNPLTKSLDDTQVGKKAPIDAGKEMIVYFMDEFSNTVASYILTDTQITAIQTGTGVKFTNLDPSVVNVYVVANVPTAPATAPGTVLAAINATVMNIYDQQTTDAASVVLANTSKTVVGLTDLNTTASNGNKNYEADITLTPIVSRIQIASITNDGTITSFNLAGIYIDNFYQKMTIDGTLSSLIKATAGQVAKFNLSTTPAATPYIKNGELFDEVVSPDLTLDLAPSGKVYGYQFFPTKGTPVTDISEVPYIILKLTNVVGKTRNFDNTKAYYVAVKAFKTTATATAITEFFPGQIYTIASIPVSENNIVTDPTQSLINVTVNVTIKEWGGVALSPDFGY
nr:hypothetical protein [uncultured Macellibacteroides sp.]